MSFGGGGGGGTTTSTSQTVAVGKSYYAIMDCF